MVSVYSLWKGHYRPRRSGRGKSVTKNITALVSGKITQDTFLNKKGIINNTIAQKNTEIERLREQLQTASTGKDAIKGRLSILRPILTIDRLDRELVGLLIEKVLIHGEKQIEIVWADKFITL